MALARRVLGILIPGFLAVSCAAYAQTSDSKTAAPGPPASPTTCNPWVIQTLPTELSFRRRFCFQLAEAASPATLLGAAAMAGYSQWRNSPRISPRDADDYSLRFEHAYERQAARATAELFVGYFHHEDPRFHSADKHGAWRRTGAALLGVLTSPGQDGGERMAFAPIAGALGSGLTSMALYQQQNSLLYGLERSGISYSGYFVRALFREFSPELWSLTPRFIRKHHEAVGRALTL